MSVMDHLEVFVHISLFLFYEIKQLKNKKIKHSFMSIERITTTEGPTSAQETIFEQNPFILTVWSTGIDSEK